MPEATKTFWVRGYAEDGGGQDDDGRHYIEEKIEAVSLRDALEKFSLVVEKARNHYNWADGLDLGLFDRNGHIGLFGARVFKRIRLFREKSIVIEEKEIIPGRGWIEESRTFDLHKTRIRRGNIVYYSKTSSNS